MRRQSKERKKFERKISLDFLLSLVRSSSPSLHRKPAHGRRLAVPSGLPTFPPVTTEVTIFKNRHAFKKGHAFKKCITQEQHWEEKQR